jgi:hypothetical protein
MPVQDYLKLNITGPIKQAEVARLLPTPLYILFTKLFAYKEAFSMCFCFIFDCTFNSLTSRLFCISKSDVCCFLCMSKDDDIDVRIEGNVEDAKREAIRKGFQIRYILPPSNIRSYDNTLSHPFNCLRVTHSFYHTFILSFF